MTPSVEQLRSSVVVSALAEIGRADVITGYVRSVGDRPPLIAVAHEYPELAWRSFTLQAIHMGWDVACWDCMARQAATGAATSYDVLAEECTHEVRF